MKRILLVLAFLAVSLMPISVMALSTPSIYTSGTLVSVSKSDAVYANARTSATGATSSTLTMYNSYSTYGGGTYSVKRAFMYFDTSLLAGYTVTAATLHFYVLGYVDTDGESMQIQSGMPTYPHVPLEIGDYDLTNYALDEIGRAHV